MKTRILRAAAVVWVLLACPSAGAPAPAERTLFLVLDCVPYSLVKRLTDPELGDAAMFQGLKGPIPLISSFPSTTSVALSGILEPFGLGISPGYEARFFDWNKRKVRGGGLLSFYRIDFPWRDFFDWNRKGPIRRMFGAARPIKSSIAWLDRSIGEFLDSDQSEFFVYIGSTDTLVHLRGPEALVEVFEALERLLAEARRKQPARPFRVVILSDHGIAGGEPLQNIWRAVRRQLKDGGWNPVQKIRHDSDVALSPFGLVSSFEAYVDSQNTREVARLLADVPGVELCTLPEAGGWTVFGESAEAHIKNRLSGGQSEWSYESKQGDPLGYLPILDRLRNAPNEFWFEDSRWLEASALADYPDALYRIARTYDLVANAASIACSLKRGFMFGAPKTGLAAKPAKGRLAWTHGALRRADTLGFIMSDRDDWNPPAAVRFDASLVPFALTMSQNRALSGDAGQGLQLNE